MNNELKKIRLTDNYNNKAFNDMFIILKNFVNPLSMGEKINLFINDLFVKECQVIDLKQFDTIAMPDYYYLLNNGLSKLNNFKLMRQKYGHVPQYLQLITLNTTYINKDAIKILTNEYLNQLNEVEK